jgi:CDP-6-deoxy-D-xylo-4-hexulose-3-dehydrase
MEKRIIRTGEFEFSDEEKRIIMGVLDSGRITEHKHTQEFERNWAKDTGTNYAVAVNSGTSALITGISSLKNLYGDEKRKKIITTPLTYIADSNAIKICGFEPVYADIEEDGFNISPTGIEKILKEQDPSEFFGILPVHLFGYPFKVDEIKDIAKKYNLHLMEDCAQAHGSLYKGKKVGSFGDFSIFSFYVAHNLQAGELGVMNTDSIKIRNMGRKVKANGRSCTCDICDRMHGNCPQQGKSSGEEDMDPRFTHDVIGYNFKTTEFSTALANHRIQFIDEINKKRRENVAYLNEGLKNHQDALKLPEYSEDVSYLAYPLVLKKGNLDTLREKLQDMGVESRTAFGCIPLQQPSFAYLKKEYEGKLPNAENIGKNGFYIGCHQSLKKEDLDYVIDSFNKVLK